MKMTPAEMIDVARMQGIYAHLETNPEITDAIQVNGDCEDLAEVGQMLIDGDKTSLNEAFAENRCHIYNSRTIPATNSIYCLYIPPFYLFIDRKIPHV